MVVELAPHILRPLGEGLKSFLFGGNRGSVNMEMYDQQIAELKNEQVDIRNYVDQQITMFQADSNAKADQIGQLERAQGKAMEQMKMLQEVVAEDSVKKQEQIDDLKEFLRITNESLKEQQAVVEEHGKKIEIIERFMANMTSFAEYLKKFSEDNKKDVDQALFMTRINGLMSDFNYLFNKFDREQNQLLEVIKNANTGFVDPRVVTPLRLVELMKEAQQHLPEGSRFPYHPDIQNAMKLYRLIDPIIYRYNYTIVFKLRIKLVQRQSLSLFKMTSAPVEVPDSGGKFVFVLPKKPYLMIDREEREYAMISEERFKGCFASTDAEFVCSDILPRAVSPDMDCEVAVLLNKQMSAKCDVRVMLLKAPIFLQLIQERSWIYLVPDGVTVVIKTSALRRSHEIDSGVGVITLTKDQTAIVGNVVLKYSPSMTYEKALSSYVPRSSLLTSVDRSELTGLTDDVFRSGKSLILPFDFEAFDEFSVSLKRASASSEGGSYLQYVILGVVLGVAVLFVIILVESKLKLRSIIKKRFDGIHEAITHSNQLKMEEEIVKDDIKMKV